MKIFGFEFNRIKEESSVEVLDTKSNYGNGTTYGTYYPIVNKNWDGEKTLGELGLVVNNIPDYERLRLRSLDAYVKSDTIKIIAKKKFDWVVGSGLKLQCEPNTTVLESEGISFDNGKFQKLVEARFMVYANSINCDYSKRQNLHQIAYEAYKGKYLAGDFLCIARFNDYGPNIQIIAAEHIKTPMIGNKLLEDAKTRGNYVEHGIEFNSQGEHIAYFICTKSEKSYLGEFERIEAIGAKSGRKLAWLVYGEKISSDHKRSVPEISQILEKANKLDRYTEAAVGKAEQAAKILNAITHQDYSTGENPLDDLVKRKLKVKGDGAEVDSFVLGDGLANRITETTSNMTINMPPGSKLESFGTDIESDYAGFESANFNKISAASGVPPEVAMQMYNSNYSASRAAINGWGYVVDIDREDYSLQFYKPFYKLWLEFEILRNKIQAPGFIKALSKNDFMVIDSYAQCRFIGKNMPHIDPLKEIKAIRAMLGDNDQTPLISREQATESLNAGEWNANYTKNKEETKIIPKEEIEPEGNNNLKS